MRSGQLLVINLATTPQAVLIRRAVEVARALRQELHICCLLDEAWLLPVLPGRREHVQRVQQKQIARCRAALNRALEEVGSAGVVADGEVTVANSVKDTAVGLARDLSPSLVLICRKRHSPLQKATLSGDDFAIIRACPAPVWVVHPEHRSGDKIVGAIDCPGFEGEGSSLDDTILEKASQLAQKLGKEHHALHTFGQAGLPQSIEPTAVDPKDDMGTSRYDRRMRSILEFGSAHGLPRERVHVHEGKLVQALEELTGSMNADLIVVGARRRGRLSRLLSASTAERVVQRVKTDVLVVKGNGPEAQVEDRRLH